MHKLIIALAFFISSNGLFSQEDLPCHGEKFKNTKTHFHASGEGSDADMNEARKKALKNVQDNLKTNILAVGDSINTAYAEGNGAMKHRLNQIWDQAINWDIKYAYNDCNKITVDNDTKINHSYQSLDIASEKILAAIIEEIHLNKNIGPSFDEEKFKALFQAEMDKF